MGAWRKLDEEVRLAIIRRFEAGETGRAIARSLGLGETSVYRVLHGAALAPMTQIRDGLREHSNRRLSDDGELALVDEYLGGASRSVLAEKYGVNPITVTNILKRRGVARRARGGAGKPWTGDDLRRVVELYDEGRSQAAIGRELGFSQTHVSRLLTASGLTKIVQSRRGPRHHAWRGGRRLHHDGYVMVKIDPSDPLFEMANLSGYVLEHRLVVARTLGRPLARGETVHHQNGDKADNRPENLQLRVGPHGKHAAYRCRACGSTDIEGVEL